VKVGDVLAASGVVVLLVEATVLLFMSAGALIHDLGHPETSTFGVDLLFAGVALAAVPVAVGIWRRGRLAWIVFAPYEIFAVALIELRSMGA
jgi:hypothetical protein